MDIRPFADRRARLLARMNTGVAVIPTAPEQVRNRDAHFPFRFDSYFYHLTGFHEPEAALVLVAGGPADKPKSILFCRTKDAERETWDGFRFGPAAARQEFGFDDAHAMADFDKMLPELLADQPNLFYSLGHDEAWDKRIIAALNQVRVNTRSGITAPVGILDVRTHLDDMRLIKDAAELATMRRAAAISCGAHRRAMAFTRPGCWEYEVEAEFLHEFRRHGSQAPAYTTIVAGGANACILHYIANDRQLKDGELVLIDAGCELDGYASDITRTFPVNGRFSPAQRDVYEITLAAQSAAIAQIRPGAHWEQPHEAALKVLVQGMVDLRLLSGTVDGLIENGDYKRFYMHRTGHWLGLDVHDAGDYKRDKAWRPLEANMVLTVEPGFYIPAADDIAPALRGIGIRIEDDALVTADGCDILTTGAPKTVAEIEATMAAGH